MKVSQDLADQINSLVFEFVDDQIDKNIDSPKYNELHSFRHWVDELTEKQS